MLSDAISSDEVRNKNWNKFFTHQSQARKLFSLTNEKQDQIFYMKSEMFKKKLCTSLTELLMQVLIISNDSRGSYIGNGILQSM